MKDPDMPTRGGSDRGFTPTEFERRLLDSARTDVIPPALKQSMQRGLHASLGGAAAGASLWSGKTGLLILVSTAALGGFASYQWLREPVQQPAARAPVVSQAPIQPPAPPSTPAPQPTAASTIQLSEEIALLDRARAALQARSPDRALSLLAQHADRFSHPALGPEAEVLRIEALVLDHQLPAARSLARKFLAANPHSPLIDRVTRLAR
jgi:hypothetical protein